MKLLNKIVAEKLATINFVDLTWKVVSKDSFKAEGERLRNEAMQKMGKQQFEELYGYYKEIFTEENESKYIITKARREFMIAQIFGRIIASEFENESDFNVFKNNFDKLRSDIFVNSSEFKEWVTKHENDKIRVLDDIIIHGRALTNLVSVIKELLFGKNYTDVAKVKQRVGVQAVVVHNGAECMQELYPYLPEDYSCAENVQKNGVPATVWKQISNAYVNLILQSGQSYAAFVDSYKLEKSFYKTLCVDKGFDYQVNNVNSTMHEVAGLDMSVYFDEYIDFSENKPFYCVRCYDKKQGTEEIETPAFAVPFVTLPVYKLNDWQFFWETTGIYQKISTSENYMRYSSDAYLYKLVTNVYSNSLAACLKLTEATSNTLKYSFGITDTEKLNTFVNALNNDYMDAGFTGLKGVDMHTLLPKVKTGGKGNRAMRLWYDFIDENMSVNYTLEDLYSLLYKYIDQLHRINEDNAVKGLDRLQGIPVFALFGILDSWLEDNNGKKLTEKAQSSLYSYMISLWDTGYANYNVDIFEIDGEKYICGYILDGEQAYHALLERDIDAAMDVVCCMRTLNIYCNFDKNDCLSKWKTLKTKLTHIDNDKVDFVEQYYRKNDTVLELLTNSEYTAKFTRKWSTTIQQLFGNKE